MIKYRKKTKLCAGAHEWITEDVYPDEPDIDVYEITYCVNCEKTYAQNHWDFLMKQV